jgi:kynurenine 3-monooxygenase
MRQKTIVVGAGPVGALAALYAAQRGHDVEVYELRGGKCQVIYAMYFGLRLAKHSSLESVECGSVLASYKQP